MPTNYIGNPVAVEAPSAAPATGVYPTLALPVDTDGGSASLYQPFKTLADFVAYLLSRDPRFSFGDGSDGAGTLDTVQTVPWASLSAGIYTMTRDAFCTNLTASAGTLKTNGWRIYCTGTLTTLGLNAIQNFGANAPAGTGAAGAATQANALGAGAAGGAGMIGSGNGSSGGGSANSPAGAGGAGGTNAGNIGGAAGAATAPSASDRQYHALPSSAQFGWVFSVSGNTWYQLQGGAGGGGGGGSSSGNGGGGGGGGGVIGIFARNIVLSAATDINCSGGTGSGYGGTSGGGGGGGGGGLLIAVYGTTNITPTAAASCAGGAGGAGNAGAGAAGATGKVLLFPWSGA